MSPRRFLANTRFTLAETVLLVFLAYCLVRMVLNGSWSNVGTGLLHPPHLVLLLAVLTGLIFRLVRVSQVGLAPLLLALGLTLASLKFQMALLGVAGVVSWLAGQTYKQTYGHFEWRGFFTKGARASAVELRKLAPLLAMVCLYPLIPVIIQGSASFDRDDILHALDLTLFRGHDPLLALEHTISTPLSEWLAFCYTGYAFIFIAVVAESYARGRARDFERLVFELTLALALGYVGYSLVPARGPLFSQKFNVSLEFHQMAEYKALLIDQLRIDRDVFPSLHTAITLLLMGACWRTARPMFWVLLPVMASIPIACVYLRYHYVVDVLAGTIVAMVTWQLGRQLYFDKNLPPLVRNCA